MVFPAKALTTEIYIKPPSGFYNYFLYRYALFGHKHSISYVVKKIAANKGDEECVDEEKYEQCKAACLTRKLSQTIKCWLPFMESLGMPVCDSPDPAKHSLQTYIKLFVLSDGSADCNCSPPCYKHIYDVAISPDPFPFPGLSIGFGTRHVIMETHKKVQVYPFVALLCDIGGWLGSTLGLCIFALFDIFLSAAEKCKKSRK